MSEGRFDDLERRLAGWRPYRTLRLPLLWILHLSYAWIPVGFLLLGLAAQKALQLLEALQAELLREIARRPHTAPLVTVSLRRDGTVEIQSTASDRAATCIRLCPGGTVDRREIRCLHASCRTRWY